jgi:hypothetical protein
VLEPRAGRRCVTSNCSLTPLLVLAEVAYPGFFRGVYIRNFFRRGSTNSVVVRGHRDRRSGGGSPPPPESGVPLNLQMNETRILIRLLRMYIQRNWEFGSALAKLRNFGRVGGGGLGLNPQRLCYMQNTDVSAAP